MNEITKSLLKDLQEDINTINSLGSNIEVVWQLEKLKKAIEYTKNQILNNI